MTPTRDRVSIPVYNLSPAYTLLMVEQYSHTPTMALHLHSLVQSHVAMQTPIRVRLHKTIVPLTFHHHTYTGTHYQYSSDDIAKMMSEASKLIEKALSISLPPPPPLLRSSTWLSQLTDIWLIHTLHKYSVQDKHVVSVRVGM